MKLVTLFLNAMRMASKIDCRRFTIDPAYQRMLEEALCADVMAPQPARVAVAPRTGGRASWRTI